MKINESFKNEIADLIEATYPSFEEHLELVRKTGFNGFPRLMIGRHGLTYQTACRMVAECVCLREKPYISFLRGEISRYDWIHARDEIDDYIIRKYTGMLH